MHALEWGGRTVKDEAGRYDGDGRVLLSVARALDFAARKHRDQRRKGHAAEPYINHLTEVARIVAEATEGKDPVAVLGALLHDTVEDTKTSAEELESEFGPAVSKVVVEVTDDKRLPKAERKRLQVEQAPHKSDRARMIKIADKISNLGSIVLSPPVEWNVERQREYFEWARKVVDGCRGVNPALDAQFDAVYKTGLATIAARRGTDEGKSQEKESG
jgi:guanosine-3',5'-bis(diphosphate) 3'-pyrophosphohydrolase